MEKQTIKINGGSVTFPSYYHKVDSMPGDPENSVPYEVQTPNAGCIVFISAEDYSRSLPREQDELIDGIRQFLSDNQGLIKVVAEKDYVYSIVKNLKEPHGVQYILTYQKFYNDFLINIQGFFEEAGMTGIRESMVYAILKGEDALGNDEDPFAGWVKDPYDDSVITGARMNLSEQEEFDEKFPGFPLSMCRELVKCLIEGE